MSDKFADGSGHENIVFKEEEYPDLNIFKSEDTYIIVLKPNYAAQFFVYYRIGKWSLLESRQQAALLAAKLMNMYDPSLPATIPVKRIIENYESCDEHFRMFFDIRHECPEFSKLYKIKGASKVHIIQVPVTSKQLNLNDCFVLDKKQLLFIWCGHNANENEKKKAAKFSQHIQMNSHDSDNIVPKIKRLNTKNFVQQLGGIPKDIKETDATDDQTFDTQRYLYVKIRQYTNGVEQDVTNTISKISKLKHDVSMYKLMKL